MGSGFDSLDCMKGFDLIKQEGLILYSCFVLESFSDILN